MIALPHKYKRVSCVNPATADIFEMTLSQSCNSVSFVNPVSADISDIELFPSFSVVRLVAVSSPVKLEMLASCAVSEVSVAISAAEIGSPDALPSASLNFGTEVGIGDVYCCRCCGGLSYVGDVDSDSDCVGQTTIRDGNCYCVGGLGFVVECGLGLQLPGGGLNVKRGCIGATERVCQGVILGIRCCDCGADIYVS